MDIIRDIARRNAEEIMMIDGVVGYGWGAWADEDGNIIAPIEYVIVVGVISEEIIPLIPVEVEGYPIEVEVVDDTLIANTGTSLIDLKRHPWFVSATTLDDLESMLLLHSHDQTSDSDCSAH